MATKALLLAFLSTITVSPTFAHANSLPAPEREAIHAKFLQQLRDPAAALETRGLSQAELKLAIDALEDAKDVPAERLTIAFENSVQAGEKHPKGPSIRNRIVHGEMCRWLAIR